MVRVGIIGAGTISRSHATGYQAAGATLVSVADIDVARGEALAKEFNIKYYEDYKVMLQGDIDAVSICLPHSLHCEAAIEAASLGKHLLIEKPISNTLEEADRMIEACRQSGVNLMVGFTHRFHPELQMARRLIGEGELGQLCLAVDNMSFGGVGNFPSWAWRKDVGGGGVLMFNGTHGIDRLRWLVGGEVVEAYAQMRMCAHEGDAEDNLVALLRFDNGVIASMIQNQCPYPVSRKCDLEIYGTKGTVRIKTWDSVEFFSDTKAFIQKRQRNEDFNNEVREFISSILEKREPLVTGEDGRACIAVALAIYESAEKGFPVRPDRTS
jgi:predicted dehydrogenase